MSALVCAARDAVDDQVSPKRRRHAVRTPAVSRSISLALVIALLASVWALTAPEATAQLGSSAQFCASPDGLEYQGDILPYLESSTDTTVPPGLYSIGDESEKGRTYSVDEDRSSWVTVKAQVPGSVVVDGSINQAAVTFEGNGSGSAKRSQKLVLAGIHWVATSVGFKSTQDVSLWYTCHEYSPQQWHVNAMTAAADAGVAVPASGPRDPHGDGGGLYALDPAGSEWNTIATSMGAFTPTALRGVATADGASRDLRFFGVDVGPTADDGISMSGTWNLVVQGARIRDASELYPQPDGSGISVDPGGVFGSGSDQFRSDGIELGTAGYNPVILDSWSSNRIMFDRAPTTARSGWDLEVRRSWFGSTPRVGAGAEAALKSTADEPAFAGWNLGNAGGPWPSEPIAVLGAPSGTPASEMSAEFSDIVYLAHDGDEFKFEGGVRITDFPNLVTNNISTSTLGLGHQDLFTSGDAIAAHHQNPANVWRSLHPYELVDSYAGLTESSFVDPGSLSAHVPDPDPIPGGDPGPDPGPDPEPDPDPGGPDLFVIPAPFESLGTADRAGSVTVLSMDSSGEIDKGRILHQGTGGVSGSNGTDDRFGAASAWGDVDGDGVDDLIVGVPQEDVGIHENAGAITVLYGAANGSITSGEVLHQGTVDIPDSNEAGDGWGTSVAAGDINGDGYDDVLVGAPLEDIGGSVDAGAVTLLLGSASGLSGVGSQQFYQGADGVLGNSEPGDGFGFGVAIMGGDEGAPVYAAASTPWEDLQGVTDAGAVTLFHAEASGLVPANPLIYAGASPSGERPQMPNTRQTGDQFGSRLVGGSDGTLLIGSPFADVNGQTDAGHVVAYSGFESGPSAVSIRQDAATPIDAGEQFGFALDIEVIDGQRMVAVGAPGDTIDGAAGAGSITVLASDGTPRGYSQASPGVPGSAQDGDAFGSYIDIGPRGAMFVGVPGEDIGALVDAGVGVVFYGTPEDPSATNVVLVQQNTDDVPNSNSAGDMWGAGWNAITPSTIAPEPPPTPDPTPEPTPAPTPAPTPTPAPPGPDPTPEPTPEPTPTPTPAPPVATGPLSSVPETTWQIDGTVNVILPVGDVVFIGGEFSALYDGGGATMTRNNLAAIDRRTGAPTSFNPDLDRRVFALTASPDQKTLYVGGSFLTSGGTKRKRLAAYDIASGDLTDFAPAVPNNSLRAVVVDDGMLYIGGLFDKVGSVERSYLARYDLATEELDMSWHPEPNARITDVIVDPTMIWISGDFTRVNNKSAEGLAAVDRDDGGLLPTDHPSYPVIDIAVFEDQLFVAGGGPGGRAASYHRTDGTEQWTIESDGNFQGVDAHDEFVYFGGHYETVERVSVGRMTRHNPDTGRLDTSWLPKVNGLRSVNTVAIENSNLYIGGDFSFVARQRHRGFAMFTPTVE